MKSLPSCLGALALLALAACNDQDADKKTAVAAAKRPDCRSVIFEDVPLTHCVADPKKHVIGMRLGPAGGAPFRSFEALALARDSKAPRIAFAMNGGMFDDAGRPIGYYVENGERTKKLNRAKGGGNFHVLPNGVFFGTGSAWAVRTADDFADKVDKRPEFGTQSGPMLVIDGELHPKISHDGQSRYIRNAVGVGTDGRAHFIIAETPLSFGKLARYYRDELQVPNALFLDGNVSSLWEPAMGRQDAGIPLGPLIVVENRAKAAR